MGDDHHSFTWSGLGDDLALLRSTVGDVGQKITGALHLLDVIVGDAGGFPLCLGTRTDYGWDWESGLRRFGEMDTDAQSSRDMEGDSNGVSEKRMEALVVVFYKLP